TTAPGIIQATIHGFQLRRNAHTLTTSCRIRIGSMIAAACTGDTTSANIGVAIAPMPEKPPLDSPRMITAKQATARVVGSLSIAAAIEAFLAGAIGPARMLRARDA